MKDLARSTSYVSARLPPCNRHCGLLPHLSLVLWFSTSSASSDHLDSSYEHRSDKLQSHTPPPRQISRSATSTSGYLVWDHIAIANQNPAPTQLMKRADKKLETLQQTRGTQGQLIAALSRIIFFTHIHISQVLW